MKGRRPPSVDTGRFLNDVLQKMIDMLDADDGMPFEEKKKSLQRFLAETRQSLLGSDLPNFDNNEKEECKNSIE